MDAFGWLFMARPSCPAQYTGLTFMLLHASRAEGLEWGFQDSPNSAQKDTACEIFQKLSSLFSLFSPWATPLPFTIWGAWPLQAKRNLTRIQREIAGRTQGVELTYVDVQYAEAQTAVAAVADNIDNIWRGYGRCIVLDCAGLHWIAGCGLQILADMCDMWDFRQWLLNRGSPSWSSWPHGAPLDISCAVSHMLRMLRATFPNIFRTWLLHSSFFFIDLLYCAGLGFTWVFWLRAWWQIASSSVGDDIWRVPWPWLSTTQRVTWLWPRLFPEKVVHQEPQPHPECRIWSRPLQHARHHGRHLFWNSIGVPCAIDGLKFRCAGPGFALFFFVSTRPWQFLMSLLTFLGNLSWAYFRFRAMY